MAAPDPVIAVCFSVNAYGFYLDDSKNDFWVVAVSKKQPSICPMGFRSFDVMGLWYGDRNTVCDILSDLGTLSPKRG